MKKKEKEKKDDPSDLVIERIIKDELFNPSNRLIALMGTYTRQHVRELEHRIRELEYKVKQLQITLSEKSNAST